MTDIVFSPALRENLAALRQARRDIDDTSLRLATGKRVNSALDNPQNFFTAASLQARAADFDRVIDGINQSLLTIREGLVGSDALTKLLDQAYAIADQSRILAAAGLPDPNVYQVGSAVGVTLQDEINADNPDAYWQLGEAAGATAGNSGTGGGGINGTYVNGPALNQPALYPGGGPSVAFDGINQRVNIPNSGLINIGARAQRTVELVFNASSVAGRQVLFEEGATINSLGIYIDKGRIHVEGRDNGAWGPLGISAPINPNQTYHVAFVFDRTTNSFTGYLDGAPIGTGGVANQNFPSHSGAVAIGGMRAGMWFHDGAQGGDNHYFQGSISDVALYNTALTPTDIQDHANALNGPVGLQFLNREFEKVMNEIDSLVLDASINGINLLNNEDLVTILNEDASHSLTTDGVNFTSQGLEVKRDIFRSEGEILQIMQSVDDAIGRVRSYTSDLATDVGILSNRVDFSKILINTHEAGAEDLTLTDLNAEGANLLALQTQQELAVTTLTLAGDAQAAVLNLFDTQ